MNLPNRQPHRNNRRPRAPGLWPVFRELALVDGKPFRVSAWRLGAAAGVVLRPIGAEDAENEIVVPLSEWCSFVYDPIKQRWERAS